MGMGFSSTKNQKMPGAHKIGAAISDPRIAGGKILDMRIFLIWGIEMFVFDLLSGIEIFFDLEFTGYRGPKKHWLIFSEI